MCRCRRCAGASGFPAILPPTRHRPTGRRHAGPTTFEPPAGGDREIERHRSRVNGGRVRRPWGTNPEGGGEEEPVAPLPRLLVRAPAPIARAGVVPTAPASRKTPTPGTQQRPVPSVLAGGGAFRRLQRGAPAGFEPAHTAPEAGEIPSLLVGQRLGWWFAGSVIPPVCRRKKCPVNPLWRIRGPARHVVGATNESGLRADRRTGLAGGRGMRAVTSGVRVGCGESWAALPRRTPGRRPKPVCSSWTTPQRRCRPYARVDRWELSVSRGRPFSGAAGLPHRPHGLTIGTGRNESQKQLRRRVRARVAWPAWSVKSKTEERPEAMRLVPSGTSVTP